MAIQNEDIQELEEEINRKYWGRGGGHRGKKSEHHGKKTAAVLYHATAMAGQKKRMLEARREILKIVDHVTDRERYKTWLSRALAGHAIYNVSDIQRHTYTSGGHGGTGRQTSRNAWDIIHVPTGIRVTSEDSRLAGQNWRVGERELIRRLHAHLDQWGVLGKTSMHAILGI